MHLPTTIEGVLDELDRILEDSLAQEDFLGLFCYVYRRTTAEIRQGLSEGLFEDPARLERLDVRFANLYIEAYRSYREGGRPSAPWALSFSVRKARLAFIQHLMLGMNAHINLDLGLAAALEADGQDLEALRADFFRVNDILFRLTREMQQRLGRVSPMMFLLDWVGGRSDEKVINFSMGKARSFSWQLAKRLHALPPAEREIRLREAAAKVTALGEVLVHPPGRLTPFALKLIARLESRDVGKVIERLRHE